MREVESHTVCSAAVAQIAPQAPYGLDEEFTAFIARHGLGAVGEAIAVTGASQGRLKERLRRHRSDIARASATSKPRDASVSAVLYFQVGVGFVEALAAQRHHVGYGIDVNRQVLILDPAPNITHFHAHLTGYLVLVGEID